jgi:hypothetical protein
MSFKLKAHVTQAEVTQLVSCKLKDLRVLVSSIMTEIRITGDRRDDQRNADVGEKESRAGGAMHGK